MSAMGGLAAYGAATLLTLGSVGQGGPRSGRGASVTMSSHRGAGTSPSADVCSLTADGGARWDPANPGGRGTAPMRQGAHSGDLTVAIPPVVFIRADARRLIVTTNTGEPPREGDSFYYVASGRAVVAGARLGHEVLSRCAAGVHLSPPR